MKIKNHLLIILVFLVFLNACQKNHKPITPKHNSWEQISSWSFDGKIAISNIQQGGSGRITWQVKEDETHAVFKAPLGQGSWSITELQGTAKLVSSKHGNSVAASAEILISNEIGWHFPWNHLKYWLRGYKTNDYLDKHKVLPDFIFEDGWKISYKKWTPTTIGMLPKKIFATKDSYSVKLIIYNWKIN